ncbi:MAG: M48 family metallopeptidase [Leptothrix ochracea]|uniref:M48 metallopeptidase family protein n=1 Tax=Leptothrix ochracea TaxID=735331 RepID=UPI0034E1A131
MEKSVLSVLNGYPQPLIDQVRQLIDHGKLGERLRQRYPQTHDIRTDRALYDHVQALKARYMRSAPPLSKVVFDGTLRLTQQALGTHTRISRVQGGQLKAKREIRIARLFRLAPEPMLAMIVVHELAHIKEREHDAAFYALCQHMLPDYHQLEFDTRLYLIDQDLQAQATPTTQPGSEPEPASSL